MRFDESRRMPRRGLLAGAATVGAGVGVLGTLALRRGKPADISPAELRQTIARVIQAYDAQGFHRTATDVDQESARWLAAEVGERDLEPKLESFVVNRVDPVTNVVQWGDHRIEGVPLFDGSFTGAAGVRGRLGPINSDAEIGVVPVDGAGLAQFLEIRQTTKHRALVAITRGGHPGLSLMNASHFQHPSGPPVIQVGSREQELLLASAAARTRVHMVVHAVRVRAEALNVTARLPGTGKGRPPLVIMTPRSGWWQCAAERGGGLACWLEVMRHLRTRPSPLAIEFVASSGHELGYLGIEAFLGTRPGLAHEALAWIHFGANVGAASEVNNLLQASDDRLDRLASDSLAEAGIPVNRRSPRGAVPLGEAELVHRGGGRYVSILGANRFFHNPADRWPDAVDINAVTRHIAAFNRLADVLCRQASRRD
jgi:hypothetical protein